MRVYLSLALLAVLSAVWVWDWVCIVKRAPGDTVSAAMLQWSTEWPLLPFLVGVVVGHIFWPNR